MFPTQGRKPVYRVPLSDCRTPVRHPRLREDCFGGSPGSSVGNFSAARLIRFDSARVNDFMRAALKQVPGSGSFETAGPSIPELNRLIGDIAENRSRAAFAELFSHFAPRIKGFIMRSGTSEELAEEIVQETMVTVWTKAMQFDAARAGASTWIFTIARNKRIDILRRVSRPEPDPEDPMFQPDPPMSGEEFTQSREDQVRIRAALEHLPPEQVEIVRLSFFDSLTHSEIAERLSLPLGTVKSRLRLSFRKIRSALGDER